ncbi:hypothetical protein TU82_27415, partial [Pseudomonas orientalis]
GVLVCPVSDLKLLGAATFILAATAQCDAEELRQRLPAHLKIGPVERIRELVNLHLAGIKVNPLPVAPRQIPFHAAKTYFMLDMSARDIAGTHVEHEIGLGGMKRNLPRRHRQRVDLDPGKVQVDQLPYALYRPNLQMSRQALAQFLCVTLRRGGQDECGRTEQFQIAHRAHQHA